MERYWCLRWVQQESLTRADAVVVRDDLVRLAQAPLYVRVPDLPVLPPGRRVVIDIIEHDLIDLSISARYHGLAAEGGSAAPSGLTDDEADEAEFAEEG